MFHFFPLIENFNASMNKEKNNVVYNHAQILNKMGLSQYIGRKFRIVTRLVLCYLLSQNREPKDFSLLKSFPISHGDSHSLHTELMRKDLVRKEGRSRGRDLDCSLSLL